MKTLLSCLTVFSLNIVLLPQLMAASIGQIMGRVVLDSAQQPIAFAEITFENNIDKVIVTANEYGYYYGHRIPTGKYNMTVKYNNRTFVMKRVRIYDGYATEVNFTVSNKPDLPGLVEVPHGGALVSAVSPTDILITGENQPPGTQTLTDLLLM